MITWDREVKGLHLRVLKTKSTYYLYYRTRSGTQRRPKIGDAGTLSITQARRIAREWLAEVILGKDPSLQTRQLRIEPRVFEAYAAARAEHWEKPRYQASGWAAEVEGLYRRHIHPHLGHLKMSEVTAEQVRSWHARLPAVTGNRCLAVLGVVFKGQTRNPCTGIKPHTERKRNRYASKEELQKILTVIDRERAAHPRECGFLEVLIFTGSRPEAIESVDWGSAVGGVVHFSGKSTATTGDKESLVLPGFLLERIRSLPSLGKFPRRFWAHVCREAGIEGLWARDLRRTFASIGMAEGLGMDQISEVLNHASTQTTKRYAKLDDSSRVRTALRIVERIEALGKPKLLTA